MKNDENLHIRLPKYIKDALKKAAKDNDRTSAAHAKRAIVRDLRAGGYLERD
jgi:hypothetical protein